MLPAKAECSLDERSRWTNFDWEKQSTCLLKMKRGFVHNSASRMLAGSAVTMATFDTEKQGSNVQGKILGHLLRDARFCAHNNASCRVAGSAITMGHFGQRNASNCHFGQIAFLGSLAGNGDAGFFTVFNASAYFYD